MPIDVVEIESGDSPPPATGNSRLVCVFLLIVLSGYTFVVSFAVRWVTWLGIDLTPVWRFLIDDGRRVIGQIATNARPLSGRDVPWLLTPVLLGWGLMKLARHGRDAVVALRRLRPPPPASRGNRRRSHPLRTFALVYFGLAALTYAGLWLFDERDATLAWGRAYLVGPNQRRTLEFLTLVGPVVAVYLWLFLWANVHTLLLFGADKGRAQQQRRRIPEAVLHSWEACGGWFGAYTGQQLFRHKTQKESYHDGTSLSLGRWLLVSLAYFGVFGLGWMARPHTSAGFRTTYQEILALSPSDTLWAVTRQREVLELTTEESRMVVRSRQSLSPANSPAIPSGSRSRRPSLWRFAAEDRGLVEISPHGAVTYFSLPTVNGILVRQNEQFPEAYDFEFFAPRVQAVFSPDGQTLAVATNDGIDVFSTETLRRGREQTTVEDKPEPRKPRPAANVQWLLPPALGWLSPARLAYAGSARNPHPIFAELAPTATVCGVWDLVEAKAVRQFNLAVDHQTPGFPVALAPDGERLLIRGKEGWVLARFLPDLNRAEESTPRFVRIAHAEEFEFAEFSPDGRWLAAQVGPKLCVWDAVTGVRRHAFTTRASCFRWNAASDGFLTCVDGHLERLGLPP